MIVDSGVTSWKFRTTDFAVDDADDNVPIALFDHQWPTISFVLARISFFQPISAHDGTV